MPTIFASLILSLIFFQSSDKEKKTDLEYDELNGPVRLVRIETEHPQGRTGNPKNNERGLDKIIVYDLNGMKSEEVSFRKDCARERHIFKYDDKNNRTETLFWGQSIATGKPDDSQVGGTPIRFKQAFKLDDFGRRSEMQDYDAKGNLYSKQIYKYDDKGRIKEVAFAYDNSVRSRCEFKYNDKGLPDEKTCKDKESNSPEKTTYAYEYDGNGNWIKKTATHTSTLVNGSPYESQVITYREIKLYTSKLARPEDTADSIDGVKLVPCPPMVIRKSGRVLQDSAIKHVVPRYPSAARDAGISGAVVVEVTVNEAGKVISARTISGPSELRAVSEEAAKGWEFKPTTLSRIPIKVIGTITFNFNL